MDARNKCGETPLILGCKEGNTEAVKFLLQHSNEIDFNTMSTAHDNEEMYAALHVACMNGHTEIVRLFLEHTMDIDFNAKSTDAEDPTPLHLACRYGHLDIVELLLDNSKEKGIDAMARNRYGRTTFESCKNASIRELFYERNLKYFRVEEEDERLTVIMVSLVIFASLFKIITSLC